MAALVPGAQASQPSDRGHYIAVYKLLPWCLMIAPEWPYPTRSLCLDSMLITMMGVVWLFMSILLLGGCMAEALPPHFPQRHTCSLTSLFPDAPLALSLARGLGLSRNSMGWRRPSG